MVCTYLNGTRLRVTLTHLKASLPRVGCFTPQECNLYYMTADSPIKIELTKLVRASYTVHVIALEVINGR